MKMKKIKAFLIKNKDKKITRLLFVIVLSMILGGITVCIGKKMPMFKSDKADHDFFMNTYFTRKVSGVYRTPRFDSVVLIEAGHLNRIELAEMLRFVDSLNPKVIGFDILHGKSAEDVKVDSILVSSLLQCRTKIVLPLYEDEQSQLVTPFYFEQTKDSLLFGSVVFDNPWCHQSKQGKFSSFAFLIAREYLGKEIDTASFIVNYKPMRLNRFYYNISQKRLIDKTSENDPSWIKGKIVLIGTTQRILDGLTMPFPVFYSDLSVIEADNVIPGMIELSYQIRSFLDSDYRIRKTSKFFNFILSTVLVVFYYFFGFTMIACLENRLRIWEKKKEKKQNKLVLWLWKFMPVIKLIILVIFEILIILSVTPVVHCFGMPDIWLAMASLPFVNVLDVVYRYRFFKNTLVNTDDE